jgi:hypothetical protein
MSWLERYVAYTAEADTPPLFDWWTGVAVVSGMLGRRVWAKVAPDHDKLAWLVHPNMYIVLFGEAGTGKSLAIKFAKDLMREVGGIALAPDTTSRAAFQEDLYNYQGQLLVFTGEFAQFLHGTSTGKAKADSDWIVFLCRLFDLEMQLSYRTKKDGLVTVPEPFVTILGGITPKILSEVLPPTSVGAGIASRTLIIAVDENVRTFEPNVHLKDMIRPELLKGLISMQTMQGEMAFTGDATETYRNWKNAFLAGLERMSEVDARVMEYVVRVAMICAASNGRMNITDADVKHAVKNVEEILPGTRSAFSRTYDNKLAWIIDDITERVTKTGPKTRAWFMKFYRHYATLAQLEATLKHACAAEQITTKGGKIWPFVGLAKSAKKEATDGTET